jgi:hypothetical protein
MGKNYRATGVRTLTVEDAMIYKRQGRWVPAWEMVGENEGFADLSLNAEELEKLDAFLSHYESVEKRRMA